MNEHRHAALAQLLHDPVTPITTEWGDDLVLASFLRPHLAGVHPYLREADLPRGIDIKAALPAGAQLIRQITRPHSTHVVAAVQDVALCLRSWDSYADCWVSGTTESAIASVHDAVLAGVPVKVDAERVELHFWNATSHGGNRRTRTLTAPTWETVSGNYSPGVQRAMSELVAMSAPGEGGGRLLLWHGPPGTGKTTAARALLRSWRGWARGHYVTDPERLFNDANYLNRVVLTEDDDDDLRWRLVVIEDAEEFTRRDARSASGQALGRLLNLTDGMLGQGLQTLFLLTSNQESRDLHTALIRPGRCLSAVEFGRLSAQQSSQLAGRPVSQPMTLAEALAPQEQLTPDRAPGNPSVGLYL